ARWPIDRKACPHHLVQPLLHPADVLWASSVGGRRRLVEHRHVERLELTRWRGPPRSSVDESALRVRPYDAVGRKPRSLLKATDGAAGLRRHDAIYRQLQPHDEIQRALNPSNVLARGRRARFLYGLYSGAGRLGAPRNRVCHGPGSWPRSGPWPGSWSGQGARLRARWAAGGTRAPTARAPAPLLFPAVEVECTHRWPRVRRNGAV